MVSNKCCHYREEGDATANGKQSEDFSQGLLLIPSRPRLLGRSEKPEQRAGPNLVP